MEVSRLSYLVYFLILLPLLVLLTGCEDDKPVLQKDGFVAIERNDMTLAWKRVGDDRVEFHLWAPTEKGWVGIGFNPIERMKGAHIVLGSIYKEKSKVEEHVGNSLFTHIPKEDAKVATLMFGGQIEKVKKGMLLKVIWPIAKEIKKIKMIMAFGQSHRFSSYHSLNRVTVDIDL